MTTQLPAPRRIAWRQIVDMLLSRALVGIVVAVSKQLRTKPSEVTSPSDDDRSTADEGFIEPDEVDQLLAKHTRRWAGVLERLK